MIDLSRTRAELLAEIAASSPLGDPLTDLADPRLLAPHARALVRGHTRDELFPLLKVVLSARFAAFSRAELNRDLLVPLKSALGNAHKHGNRGDAGKWISVEAVLTPKGALLAVSDEGDGFDVAAALHDLRGGARYFANLGAGLRRLERATSSVSYENGGRTLLLRFLPAPGQARRPAPFALPAGLLGLGQRPDGFESGQMYASPGAGGDDPVIRYVLRSGGDDARSPQATILTGRLHADAAAAAADLDAAARLHDRLELKRVWIPRPVGPLAGEPRLALYDFDPWMDFGEYVAERDDLEILRRRAARVGQALAALHRSRIAFVKTESELVGERFRALGARSSSRLEALQGGTELPRRLQSVLRRIEAQAAALPARSLAPIHGRFGFHSVLYGVDGRFYLFRFEACRRSRPELDLGGFLADLRSLATMQGDEAVYDAGTAGFLAGYSSPQPHSTDREDLGLHVALALVERLDRLDLRDGAAVDSLLRDCEQSLGERS